jgi:hypothetical protein
MPLIFAAWQEYKFLYGNGVAVGSDFIFAWLKDEVLS